MNEDKRLTATKSLGDYTVELYQQDVHRKGFVEHEDGSPTSDFRETTDGVGVVLSATLRGKDGYAVPLFSRQVRGTGRYGDHFDRWYSAITDLKTDGEDIYVTLESASRMDTYKVGKDKEVRLYETLDKEALKLRKAKEAFKQRAKDLSLDDVLSEAAGLIKQENSSNSSREPDVHIRKVGEIGLVVLAQYHRGYDPMVGDLQIYKVDSTGNYIEHSHVVLPEYDRPKNSLTYFHLDDLAIKDNKIHLTGTVRQQLWNSNPVDIDTISKWIPVDLPKYDRDAGRWV